MKILKTPWEKFIAVIYVLSFVFSLIALILTIFALNHWPITYETVEWTREILSKFGYFGGAILIGLAKFIWTFIPPIAFVIISRYLEYERIAKRLFHFLIYAFVEAYGLFTLSFSFLDMSADALVINSILHKKPMRAPLSASSITSIAILLFLIVLILSFSARILRFHSMRAREQ